MLQFDLPIDGSLRWPPIATVPRKSSPVDYMKQTFVPRTRRVSADGTADLCEGSGWFDGVSRMKKGEQDPFI